MKEETIDRIEACFQRALDQVDGTIEVLRSSENQLRASFQVANRRYEAQLLWAPRGFPADSAILRGPADHTLPLIVAAPRVSPGLRDHLVERGIGYVDEAGQARIVIDPGLAIIIDRPPPRFGPTRTEPQMRWSGSAEAVGEYVLRRCAEQRGEAVLPPVQHIAERTGWSPQQVSSVLQRFDDFGWTEKRGASRGPTAARWASAPGDLLDAWAEAVRATDRTTRRAHYPGPGVVGWFLTEATGVLGRDGWCLTGQAAAMEWAPYMLEPRVVECYVGPSLWRSLRTVAADLDVTWVEEGERLRFIKAEASTLGLAGNPSGTPVASAARTYADLPSAASREVVAAEEFRGFALGF